VGRASTDVARLLFPALRWDGDRYALEGLDEDGDLPRRVGGYILFGGTADAARARIEGLRARSDRPLVFAADLERGAGQQLEGCTPLPPAGALGALGESEVIRGAAALTAREARAVGIDWLFGPVADLDVEPANPIVGPRAFGGDPGAVARAVVAWLDGGADGGAFGCVKHFPGHGRTTADSHRELPVVEALRHALEADLRPFHAAIEHGVASVMTAHVAYPALDPSGRPATRSAAVVQGLLRGELGFDGPVVTDALIMQGATGGEGPVRAAVEAIAAGVDALLYPEDVAAVAAGVAEAIEEGVLAPARVDEAIARIESLAAGRGKAPAATGSGGSPPRLGVGGAEARRWAASVARRCVRWLPGAEASPELRAGVDLRVVDDDVGGPYPPPSREPLRRAFGARSGAGGDPRGDGADVADAEGPTRIVAVFADTRGWKGRAGLSDDGRKAVREAIPAGTPTGRSEGGDAVILLFGHPRTRADLPSGVPVLCAWGGEALMQRAAVDVLLGRAPSTEGASDAGPTEPRTSGAGTGG